MNRVVGAKNYRKKTVIPGQQQRRNDQIKEANRGKNNCAVSQSVNPKRLGFAHG